jgi:hypothetical protein
MSMDWANWSRSSCSIWARAHSSHEADYTNAFVGAAEAAKPVPFPMRRRT